MRETRVGVLACVIAALAISRPAGAGEAAAEPPMPQPSRAVTANPPKNWTVETRKVKVAAPGGEVEKTITSWKNSIGMELVLIPAGEFMMGGDEPPEQVALKCGIQGDALAFQPEQPQHLVRVSKPFFMGKYPVTQGQWQSVMGNNPSYFKGEQNPVEMVSWTNAAEFCKKLSEKDGATYRLPTEAEWEYAGRAGTTNPFYFGENLSTDVANYDGNYTYGSLRTGQDRQKTTPVGSFPSNAFGLCDMCGNVFEWCSDWFGPGYYWSSPADGPAGPAKGRTRVIRGGSMESGPGYCRSAFRGEALPSLRLPYLGLRVVCEGAAR